MSVKVGDVFYTSWGYDQTNVELMRVIELSRSGKTVVCRMLGKNRESVGGYDNISPGSELYGKPFKMYVRTWSEKPILRGSYPFCNDDATRLGSAYLYDHPVYETAFGYGH